MDICKSLSFLRIRKNFAAILVNLGKIAFAFIKNRQNFLAQALLTILGCKGGALLQHPLKGRVLIWKKSLSSKIIRICESF